MNKEEARVASGGRDHKGENMTRSELPHMLSSEGGYETFARVLDDMGISGEALGRSRVLVKPNLLTRKGPPCTTSVKLIDMICRYFRERSGDVEICVIEGPGDCSAREAYESLGYSGLEKKYRVRLLDVDELPAVCVSNNSLPVFRQVFLPEILFDNVYFISAPALKVHSICGVTLSLKNLIGLLPSQHYGGYWSFKRSRVHEIDVDLAICDLNEYVKIDLAVIDASIGQKDSHMPGGRPMDPPVRRYIVGRNPFLCDCKGAELLGLRWDAVPHLVEFSRRRGYNGREVEECLKETVII